MLYYTHTLRDLPAAGRECLLLIVDRGNRFPKYLAIMFTIL